MKLGRSTLVIFACVAAFILAACGSVLAANLLVNGGFESGPYGVPFDKPATPCVQGVWYSEGADAANLFEGIFDSTWHNPAPAEHPDWPTSFAPFEGSYYLGRYNINQPWGTPLGGLMGAAYQLVPVSPSTTYYFNAWHVGFHPQGGGAGVRIGIDPTGTVDPTTGRPSWGSTDIVWFPAEGVDNEGKKYPVFESTDNWKKIQVAATTDASATQAIAWIEYKMTSNNVALPQIVQVDAASFSTQQSALFIKDMFIQGVSNTFYQPQWRVTDGVTDVAATCTCTLNTPGGPVTKSVTYDPATKLYKTLLTGLVANTAYTFTVNATLTNYDPATYTGAFTSYPALDLKNVSVTGLTSSGATVSWDTFEKNTSNLVATTGTLQYGDNYSFSATDTPGPNPTLKTHHSITLTNLLPNKIYQYRCVSDRPVGSTNPGPYGTAIVTGSFQTLGGQFFNGDFEQAYSLPIHTGDPIPGWTKFNDNTFYRDPSWFPSFEWSIPAKSGGRYLGFASNYGGPGKGGVYQNFTTTPGELVVMSTWVWSEGYSPNGFTGITGDGPHRFGETSVKIGIDPTGQISPGSENIIWSADRETLDWNLYATTGLHHVGWQKIQTAAVATGTNATVFLKLDNLWANPWILCGFDNVTKEVGPTPVTSVAAAKQLDNDTAIHLSGNVVVTYIANGSDLLMSENYQKPYFYVQDEDGTAGIKVVMANPNDTLPGDLAIGKRISIDGMISWGAFYNPTNLPGYYDQQWRLNKPCGERVIKVLPGRLTVGATGNMPKAVGMSNKDLCGGSSSDHWFTNPGVDGGTGVNNVGKLVKIWGKMIYAGVCGTGTHVQRYYVVIDDGSGVPRYGNNATDPPAYGVFIDVGSMGMAEQTYYDLSAHMGEYAVVTGISAPALDFDYDDWQTGMLTDPEALKNVRSIKPLSFSSPDFVFMPAQ